MPPLNNDSSWRIQRLEEDSARHEKDLYRGNGLPGLTTRMAKVEDAITTLEELLQQMKKSRDTKINLVLGGIVTLLAGLLLAHLKII